MSTSGGQGGTAMGAVRPGGQGSTQPQPQPRPRPRGAGGSAPRHVKLTVSRVDPWSVMKISFLLSVALGIAGVVLVAVLWTLLSGMGVFADLNGIITDLTKNEAAATSFNLMDYLGFGRLVSLSVVIGVIDIILLTAIATVGAFLYNICASLVGGLQLTLSDD